MAKDIEKDLKEVLAKRLSINPAKISRNSDLQNDLGMDSFSAIETMFGIEEKFNIKADEKELGNIKTVGDLLDYIKGKQKIK